MAPYLWMHTCTAANKINHKIWLQHKEEEYYFKIEIQPIEKQPYNNHYLQKRSCTSVVAEKEVKEGYQNH